MFEIGNSLREARVRQGLDHAHVELATKIRAKYVRALEDEEFSILPGDTYIKGFLRAYADYLGLDGQLYVDEYASRFTSSWREEAPLHRSHARARERTIERRAVLLALLGIAALTALVIVAWKFGGASPSGSVAPPARSGTGQAALGTLRELELRGVGTGTYVEVRRDSAAGAILLEATVPRGGVEKLVGSTFYLYVRAPAGLRVTLGGKRVALPAVRNLRVVVSPHATTRVRG